MYERVLFVFVLEHVCCARTPQEHVHITSSFLLYLCLKYRHRVFVFVVFATCLGRLDTVVKYLDSNSLGQFHQATCGKRSHTQPCAITPHDPHSPKKLNTQYHKPAVQAVCANMCGQLVTGASSSTKGYWFGSLRL